MDLVLLLLAVGVVGGAAAVALGRVRGGLEPPTSTLPQVDLPPGPLSPDDVDRVRFSLGLRGYRMDQVDEVLARLRGELAHRDDVIAALRDTDHRPPDPAPPDPASTVPGHLTKEDR